jgi:hypothetical protein
VVSAELRAAESEIDNVPLRNALVEQPFSQAAWRFMAANEERVVREIIKADQTGTSKHDQYYAALFDSIVASTKWPMRWLLGKCRAGENVPRFVRVESLKTTTTTSRSRIFNLTLERREEQRDSLIEMSINGRSAAELAEIALRVALFHERNPLQDQHMGFMTEMPDPLEPLRAARVPDEVVRPLTELLLVDQLVGSGRAERVTVFKLGASVAGMRKLTLEWLPVRYYTNERPTTRRIEGQVPL